MKHEEADAQMAVVEYCRIKGYPYDQIFAIENEKKTTPQAGKRAKDMGKRSGVPDLFLPVMRFPYGGLFIEMKAPDGRLSPTQKAVIPQLQYEGYVVEVCHSHKEAIAAIETYLTRNLEEQ